MIKCPFHGHQVVEADRIGVETHEELGFEVGLYRCRLEPSHEWRRPTHAFNLRSFAYGEPWRDYARCFGLV